MSKEQKYYLSSNIHKNIKWLHFAYWLHFVARKPKWLHFVAPVTFCGRLHFAALQQMYLYITDKYMKITQLDLLGAELSCYNEYFKCARFSNVFFL